MKRDPQSETSNSQQLLACQVTDRSEDGSQPPVCLYVFVNRHACMGLCLNVFEGISSCFDCETLSLMNAWLHTPPSSGSVNVHMN